eukprot:2862501-Prymnesium_polylepis.1
MGDAEDEIEEDLTHEQPAMARDGGVVLDEMLQTDADLRKIRYYTRIGCYREAERLLNMYGPEAADSDDEDDRKSRATMAAGTAAGEVSDDDEETGAAEVDSEEDSDDDDDDDDESVESDDDVLPFPVKYAKFNMKEALAQAFDAGMAEGADADAVVEKMRQLTQ